MAVLSEEKLIVFLDRVITISKDTLPLLASRGTEPPPPEIEIEYRRLVEDLAQERENDSKLQDEAWDWIFQPPDEPKLIRLYGRLAWINLQLMELM